MLRRLVSPCFLVRYCLLLKKETVITQRTHAIRHIYFPLPSSFRTIKPQQLRTILAEILFKLNTRSGVTSSLTSHNVVSESALRVCAVWATRLRGSGEGWATAL